MNNSRSFWVTGASNGLGLALLQGLLDQGHRVAASGKDAPAFEALGERYGQQFLQVPWQWWVHEAPYDYFRYTPYGLKYMFSKAGFVDVAVEPQSGFFGMWFMKMNYFSARFIRGPRPLRWLIKAALIVFLWTPAQLLAPFLDKLDRHWEAEAPGYFVLAKKLK